MKLSKNDIKEIASTIVNSVHPEQILLFGSYAKGTATNDSDLDLLVVMKTDAPQYQRSVAIRHLFWPPKTPMDIIVYTPEEIQRWNGTSNHIVTNAFSNGEVLYAA